MDEGGGNIREIIATAVAFDNECRRRDAESDQRLAALRERHEQTLEQRKRGSDELLYKTYITAPPPAQSQQQTMDDASSAAWNRWLAAGVRKHIEAFSDVAYELLGEEAGRLEARLNKEIAELREEIAALRCDVAIENSVRKQQVISLPQFIQKRRNNDAA